MKKRYPEWVLRHKTKGRAIHRIGNNYYLYEVTSRWDPNIKRARKITKGYLGVIVPDGLRKPGYRRNKPTSVKEYGASVFLLQDNQDIVKKLKEYFFDWWKEIIVLSIIRLMYQSPLKHAKLHYQDSWSSEEIKDARLGEKSLHNLLEEIGRSRAKIVEFLRSFITKGQALLIDLTHVFSLSENIILSAKGYNAQFDFTPQVNLLFLFSSTQKLPLFYRLLPGNVRDVSTLKATITESGVGEVTIIGDKGFYSRENVEFLEKEALRYILPLKRDNSLIDYGILERGERRKFEGYFKFNDRYIWYYECRKGLWLFLDEKLKIKEQEDYLVRIETHPELGYTIEGFHSSLHKLGTISLLTNLKAASAKEVFQYFKSRAQIEAMVDTFKNTLRADRSYMRSDYSMESWMFINYLSLVYYYKIYQILINNDLLSKYSVSDFLLYLSKFRKVKVSKHWIDLEIPKQTRRLIERINLPIT